MSSRTARPEKLIQTALLTRMMGILLILGGVATAFAQDQTSSNLTPLQSAIQQQERRIASGDVEERRDALMRLGSMRHPAASRTAASALTDVSATVRVAAAMAVASLPADECASLLIPLLGDKDEFVRQEVAYSLGKSKSRMAVGPLTELLATDKKSGPRAAAVVSLGLLQDETAVIPLARLLAPGVGDISGKGKLRSERNEFLLRAAARSLGQIRSRAGVPALLAALENSHYSADVRREAAIALGHIGSPESIPALRRVLVSEDPYLAAAAAESLKRIPS